MASVSAQYIKDILKTLPIGYYLGERAEIEFSETAPTSMCNPVTGNILISANNVLEALEDMPDDADTEEFIRDALYHEVSHLILTPRCATGYGTYERKIYPYMNIFEDERIECILKNFYRKVNFKRFVFIMNHWTPDQKINDATQFFFNIVRYRQGPEEFVKKVPELILKWHEINCNTTNYEEPSEWFKKNYMNGTDVYGYSYGYSPYDHEIYDFWRKVAEYWKKNQSLDLPSRNENQEQSNPFEDNFNQDTTQDKSSSENSISPAENDETQNDVFGDEEETEDNASNMENDVADDSTSEGEETDQKDPIEVAIEEANSKEDLDSDTVSDVCSNIKNIIHAAMNTYADPVVASSVRRIITRACKKRMNRTGVVNKYAGKIDPKSVGIRHDYKWFQQGGDNGCSKFNRVHLTLWVDRSGSFSSAMHKLNCMLKSLNDAEKLMPKDFSFDIVAMEYDNEEVPKGMPLVASGGNFFGPNVEELSKKLTRPGWSNYNVVVWDGDLASDRKRKVGCSTISDYLRAYRRAFNVFNNQHSIIVTDTFNERYLKKLCRNARMKLLPGIGYAETFTKTVLDLLDHML